MIFISIITLIAAKALPVFTKISSIHISRIASIIFIYTGASSFNCFYIQSIGSGIGIYSGLFHITPISQLMEIFLFFIGGCILIGWPQVVQRDTSTNKGCVVAPVSITLEANEVLNSPCAFAKWKANVDKDTNTDTKFPPLNTTLESYSTDYSIIVLFSILGSSLLISSFDLISVYLSIELQSFGLYILATLYRNSESATSAGLKYFLLGGFSSCLILLGIGLIYSYTGLTNFESIYLLNSISGIDQTTVLQGLSLGLIIIFVGFLFKIAAAPLHNWSPERGLGKSSIVGIKLSNSGNTLELTIPKHNRKVGGGWSNYSCMVTSRKASEKNVGNRGSKSVIFKSFNFIVKEQRVNGSCFINKNLMKLRCTLMGNERSYQVKIPSNQIIQRRFILLNPI